MSKTKTTQAKQPVKKYVSFSYGNTYSIDLENKLISPTDMKSILDLNEFGAELSLDGYEYTVLAVHKVDYESDMFKKNIEKAHTIQHFSDDIAIYRNTHERAFCMRLAIEDDIVLVELM